MHNKTLLASLIALPVLGLSGLANAAELDIRITNLTHGNHFTPLLVAAHPAGQHLFQPGEAASSSLQAMAEGGDISGLVADLATMNADVVENPASGLLAPGSSTEFHLSTGMDNGQLSVVAMILPTNDGFVGLDAIDIPAEPGTYSWTLNAWDAGTEANDEIINGGGEPGVAGIPADPLGKGGMNATGVTDMEDNDRVHIHRGIIGDSDPTAGISDLDSRVHRWLNPVARITITVN
jgi:hypothetical protein